MTRLGPFTLEVSPDAMRDFADLLNDPNPIHLDPEAAGGRVINQGPANCGYVIAMLGQAFPGAEIHGLHFRFLAPVRGGDRVVAGGEITEQDGSDVRCRVWLDIDGGPRAVEGTASVRRS
jgi:3-hydroxybutyryl-CoA dehydratase